MLSADDISIYKETKIIDALKIIDKSSKQICLVIDRNNKLIGTVNDGDIRRGLLKNISIEDSVDKVFFQSPTVGYINDSKRVIFNLMKMNKIHQLPIVDSNNNVQGIEILDDILVGDVRANEVFLMVGGLGKRLRPLTEKIPKPMLKVGGKPILQNIVEEFVSQGFKNINMCVGYKSEVVENFFGDGSVFGANIKYINEKKRLGTAGALGLIERKLVDPLIVMNGDLLTKVNFKHLLNFHISNNSDATMCLRKYDFEVPFGVVNTIKENIISIEEKPVHNFFVNAGIYMLNPECLNLIPKNKFYDMTSLFDELINENKNVISFPLREYWLDIGISEEFKKANNEFNDIH